MAWYLHVPISLERRAPAECEDGGRDPVADNDEAGDPERVTETFYDAEDSVIEEKEGDFRADCVEEVEGLYADEGLDRILLLASKAAVAVGNHRTF